jgi:hypothetical protein
VCLVSEHRFAASAEALRPTVSHRFVVGKSKDPSYDAALRREQERFGDLVTLDVDDHYLNLVTKTKSFIR